MQKHPSKLHGLRLGSLVLAVAFATQGLASAQKSIESIDNETWRMLNSRNREELHPGDPLDLIGVNEGDNDAFAGTPALARGGGAPVMVDPDENYRRRLALYEGASFDSGVRRANEARDGRPDARAPSSGATGEPVEESDSGAGFWRWVLGVGLIAGGIAAVRSLRS